MNSAIRRYHYRRVQKARSDYWFGREIKHSPQQAGMIIATPHPCLCRGCGNPRKHEKRKTIQERRNFQYDSLIRAGGSMLS